MQSLSAIDLVPGEQRFEELVSQLSGLFDEKCVTFFSGAGVSQPSGLPTSPVLVRALVDVMVKSLEKTGVGQPAEHEAVRSVLENYPLERLLDALVDVHGDQAALDFLSVLRSAEENYNHIAVAELAAKGLIDRIVTLNFDVLFEKALEDRGVSFSWKLPLTSSGRIPNSNSTALIVKPHGTLPFAGYPYESYYLAAVLRYAGDRPQRETFQEFSKVLDESPVLLVAGYSNNDWDISPLLTALPWSRVYWCEFVHPSELGASPLNQPCERILKWMQSRPRESTFLLRGDIRTLWRAILGEPDSAEVWKVQPQRMSDASMFLQTPPRTALATVRLLDGTATALHRLLLPQLAKIRSLASDTLLRRRYARSVSWLHHTQKRDFRRAITIHRRLLSEMRDATLDDSLEILHDLKTLYYEYISAAKRPLLNLRWPLDLFRAARIWKLIQQRVMTVKASKGVTSWAAKEAERQEAYAAYYRVDLLHNWGYHLLFLDNRFSRSFIRRAYQSISERYRRTFDRYPILDWEYFYVRSIEAALLANQELDQSTVTAKLEDIKSMFKRIGFLGHFAYVESIEAIIANSESDFAAAEAASLQEDSGTSPSGKLRSSLLRRHFWPRTISGFASLWDMVKHSRIQK